MGLGIAVMSRLNFGQSRHGDEQNVVRRVLLLGGLPSAHGWRGGGGCGRGGLRRLRGSVLLGLSFKAGFRDSQVNHSKTYNISQILETTSAEIP